MLGSVQEITKEREGTGGTLNNAQVEGVMKGKESLFPSHESQLLWKPLAGGALTPSLSNCTVTFSPVSLLKLRAHAGTSFVTSLENGVLGSNVLHDLPVPPCSKQSNF